MQNQMATASMKLIDINKNYNNNNAILNINYISSIILGSLHTSSVSLLFST